MSSTRKLTDRIAWSDETRAIELLDWETKPEDFDRLCEHIIDREVKRAQITRERLFEVMSEQDMRREIRAAAEAFSEERHKSLVLYVGARLRWLVLPNAARRKKATGEIDDLTMKANILAGSEIARPFLPAKDFELSKRFYEALGFVKELDGEVAIFRIGPSGFILQRRFEKDWAENFMMQLMVDDLDAWWTHLTSLDLPQKFGVPAPKAPALQPWGLRVAYVVDPSGVLWHVAQRRPSVNHDK